MESAHAEDHRFVGNSLIAMPEVKTSWPHFVSITWRKRVCIVESGILEVKKNESTFHLRWWSRKLPIFEIR
jgi:hypothetical protein